MKLLGWGTGRRKTPVYTTPARRHVSISRDGIEPAIAMFDKYEVNEYLHQCSHWACKVSLQGTESYFIIKNNYSMTKKLN
jgi:hypothetical protein